MALLACNNPQTTGLVLSRNITKLVVACVLHKRKIDAAGLLMALSMGKEKGGANRSVAQSHTMPT